MYSSVDCWEIRDTQSVGLNSDGATATVTLGCAYANRFALQADLYGTRRVFPGFAGSGAPRVQSVSNVRGFGESTLVATSNGQQLQYEEARLDVQYGPLQAEPPSGDPGYDLVIESFETNFENLRLDHNSFAWDTGFGTELRPGEAPARQLRKITLVREYLGIAVIPTDVLNLIGTVNDTAYVSSLLGLTFPAETLLFGEPSATRTIRSSGASGWNLTLSFQFFYNGWNKFWRYDSEQYEPMYFGGSSTPYKNYPLS